METVKKIFLSHRFADKPIADAVRRHLGNWGFDNEIYQASAPGVGPTVGASITDEIRDALYHAKLVILIYTLTDYDWAFCMWECGLATHPKSHDTRTIVFQCNPHETPKTFEGQLLVEIDPDGIKNFTDQFFELDAFFLGEPSVRQDIKDETVENLSTALYNDLKAVIPPGQLENRYRWDFLVLQLTQNDVSALKKDESRDDLQKLAQNCRIVQEFGEALKHFGYANLEPDLKLGKLIDRWRKETKDRPSSTVDQWIKALGTEVYRAIDNSPASPNWKELNSVNYPGSWFYPVVNHVRVLPDGSMEFDVYFYRSLSGSATET
ncbi:MAG: toll/interleukin-1 receptor domain-containing protein [Desulfobacterales bacterium]|nr:MAG: toll/interleukin-1 receptor domain-containing protein [Desulfobacterales bacterium]